MTIDALSIIGHAAQAVSFQGLEDRQLMSGVSFDHGILMINGSNTRDDIHISLSNDGKTLSAQLNHNTTTYKTAGVYRVDINAGNGNNSVSVDPKVVVMINVQAGDGNDTITTGSGNDIVRSGSGNDVINTGKGNDYVEGGAGRDLINLGAGNDKAFGGDGKDTLTAGTGRDSIYGGAASDTLVVNTGDTVDGGTSKDITKWNQAAFTPVASAPAPIVTQTTKPTVRSLSLVNADTGKVVSGYGMLTNGMTLDLAKLPAHLTIIATVDGQVQSTRFAMSDGSANRIDNSVSYSLMPTDNGTSQAWKPTSTNTVKLTVTPYTADDGKGIAGTTRTLTLNLKPGNKSTPTPAPTPAPSPTPEPSPSPTGTGAPVVKIHSMTTTVIAGQAYNGEGTQTVVPGGYQVEDASFAWDFGDTAGRYNNMPGFNAAHVYETPGTYTAKLTVTAPDGESSTQTVTVNVVASNYNTIYVAASGSDSNDGSSSNAPVKTLAQALTLAGDNTQILLKRGDVFQVTHALGVNNNNVVISSYGSGTNPTLLYTGARGGNPAILSVNKSATNVAIRGLTFNSIYSTDTDDAGMPDALVVGGTAVTVQDSTFLNVAYAINANAQPTGLLVMDNKAPLATGLRDYFVWLQGSDIVIVGNTVANSTRQHIIRSGGTDRFTVAYNDFTNLDRTKNGDSLDVAKGTAVIQKGSFAYVAYNNLHGPVGVGPLGGSDGLSQPGGRFIHAAFEGNTVFGYSIDVHHGAENITFRGNTQYVDNTYGIKVEAYQSSFGRGVVDLVIDHNVSINQSTAGQFLLVQGPVDGITLTNNVYVAPNLAAGSFQTAAVYVNDTSLRSFVRIDGNVWPSPSRGTGYANGGDVFVGLDYIPSNHLTPSQWNAQNKVGTDQFTDVTLDNVASYAASVTKAVTNKKLHR